MGNTNPTKKWGWTQVLRRGWQFTYHFIMLYAYVKVSWKLLKRNKMILCLLISKTVQHANIFKGFLTLTLQILINWKTFKFIILFNTVIIILLSDIRAFYNRRRWSQQVSSVFYINFEASRYPRFYLYLFEASRYPRFFVFFFYLFQLKLWIIFS